MKYHDLLHKCARPERLVRGVLTEQTLERLKVTGLNRSILEGTEWLLTSSNSSVTIKAWQTKLGVSLETASQDLSRLEEYGILQRKLVKSQYVFDIKK